MSNNAEVAFRSGYIEKLFLKISQNSQEYTYAGVSFLIKLHAVDLQPH